MTEKVGLKGFFNFSRNQWILMILIGFLVVALPNIIGENNYREILHNSVLALLAFIGIFLCITPFLLMRKSTIDMKSFDNKIGAFYLIFTGMSVFILAIYLWFIL